MLCLGGFELYPRWVPLELVQEVKELRKDTRDQQDGQFKIQRLSN